MEVDKDGQIVITVHDIIHIAITQSDVTARLANDTLIKYLPPKSRELFTHILNNIVKRTERIDRISRVKQI